jgi:hypothetical protein
VCDRFPASRTILTISFFLLNSSQPSKISAFAPRLVINAQPIEIDNSPFLCNIPNNSHNYRDVMLLGKCDEQVERLVKELGWSDEMQKVLENIRAANQ